MQDRRRFRRLDIDLPVTMRYRGGLIPATALNVSCGGMCLATDSPEVAGEDDVELIFDLSAAEVDVSVRGRIIRVNPGSQKKLAIQFTNLFSVGHKAIERFMRKSKN